jgi:hypothetical protein
VVPTRRHHDEWGSRFRDDLRENALKECVGEPIGKQVPPVSLRSRVGMTGVRIDRRRVFGRDVPLRFSVMICERKSFENV